MTTAPRRSVLVTGGFGFLGRACARTFQARGFRVVGIGHGAWADEAAAAAHGYDRWVEADVSLAGLSALGETFDVVAHCASNGSVPYSLSHPLEAFQRTVGSTAELLEHLRRAGGDTLVIYPSSAAVYGATPDRPLVETDTPNPVSPYGFHKQMTEELLRAHAHSFGQRAVSVRFFSIYGPGLEKQLLWDAAAKLLSGAPEALFWGTGEETRDWIHVDDAATLIADLADRRETGAVVNGASGVRVTVREVLEMLRAALGVDIPIAFNGTIKAGDPRFYHADVARLDGLGWRPAISLSDGIAGYARWIQAVRGASPAN
jgi:UDP-glucose 4-epimerase